MEDVAADEDGLEVVGEGVEVFVTDWADGFAERGGVVVVVVAIDHGSGDATTSYCDFCDRIRN